jgi:hypothetical protein
MTQEMKGLLLEDRWAPVTSTMGSLELGAEQAAQAFATWQRGPPTSRGFTVEVLPVSGTLEQVLSSLLPLSGGEIQRRLFIPTRSASWLHKRDSQVCVLGETGEVVVERRMPTHREKLAELLGQLPKARVLLEASTESEWVARCLEELGHEVAIVGGWPFDVRLFHSLLHAGLSRRTNRSPIGKIEKPSPSKRLGTRRIQEKPV